METTPTRRYAGAPMSQSPNRPRWTSGCAYLIAILVLIALLGACASYPTIPVTGRLANTPISTTVDSELAKYYLAVSSGHSLETRTLLNLPSSLFRKAGLESEVNRNLMNSRLASLLRRRLSADADGEHELRLECPELQ